MMPHPTHTIPTTRRTVGGRATAIPVAAVRDVRLSLTARGLLAYILSLPEYEVIDPAAIAAENRLGPDAVVGALRELQDAGYLTAGAGR